MCGMFSQNHVLECCSYTRNVFLLLQRLADKVANDETRYDFLKIQNRSL